MQLKINFAQPVIMNKGGLNYLRIDVCPPVAIPKDKTKPNVFIAVQDRSGSMDEAVFKPRNDGRIIGQASLGREKARTKMQHANSALIKFLDYLSPNDLFGVVSFDDYIEVEWVPTSVTTENRNLIENKINAIKPRNSTNISAALQKARSLITAEMLAAYNCRIILISDGQANVGITNPDSLSSMTFDFLRDGVTVSSLGIGVDYNSAVMNAIATGGGGTLYHVSEDIEKLSDVFREELNNSAAITAKGVKLIVELPPMVEMSENMNDFRQTVNSNSIEVYIGDMYNARSVYFEVKNNFVDTGIVFNVSSEYISVDGNQEHVTASKTMAVISDVQIFNASERDETILESVISMIKNKAIRDASNHAENNDKAKMRDVIRQSSATLDNLSMHFCASEESNIGSVLDELEKISVEYSSANVSKEVLKKNYACSNRNMRES